MYDSWSVLISPSKRQESLVKPSKLFSCSIDETRGYNRLESGRPTEIQDSRRDEHRDSSVMDVKCEPASEVKNEFRIFLFN